MIGMKKMNRNYNAVNKLNVQEQSLLVVMMTHSSTTGVDPT